MNIGSKVENFTLPATGDQNISLDQFLGKRVVLYFYPKDNTPGCTNEGVAFANAHDLFTAGNTVVLGVSKDTIKSHEVFRKKHNLPFHLLSDRDGEVCKAFDVLKEKSMYGRKMVGILRSTFLIDEEGVLQKEWRGVNVKGHCEEILESLGIEMDSRDLEACRVPV